jgi:transglutaminase superfamily protein
MFYCLRHPIREYFVSKVVLASDVVLWLFRLPVLLRIHPIPVLFERLARSEDRGIVTRMNLDNAVGIVTRVSNLRLFRSRFFPKHCLRQSLALYRTLSRMGYPVEIHFGAMKDETGFQGHSWVTLEGEAVADTARSGTFKVVYSYPSARSVSASSDRNELRESKNEHQFNGGQK